MQRDVMYHNNPETKKHEMFSNILGLNDLHMKCFQEMYLDTCQALAACGSASGSSPSYSYSTSPSDTTTNNSMISPLSISPRSSRSNSPSAGGGGGVNVLSALQQQQLIAVHQQHLAVAAMAQHQMALAAASAGNPENAVGTTTQQSPDEISKSLKMFAMLTAYSNGNEQFALAPPQMPTPSTVDSVMQEFASNGYICDELNRYHLGMHLSNASHLKGNAAHLKANTGAVPGAGITGVNTSTTSLLTAAVNQHRSNGQATTINGETGASASQHPQMTQHHNVNLNFNNNFWKMFPAHLQQHSNVVTAAAAAAAAATATAAAAANIEYSSNPKKITKRFNGTKNEKHTSTTHCVFCENNNEPEEVVKSHSVRDSFGRVLCPKLRTYTCPICKASGDMAHTVKYCPQKKIITMEDAIKAESFRLAKGTYYKQQMKI